MAAQPERHGVVLSPAQQALINDLTRRYEVQLFDSSIATRPMRKVSSDVMGRLVSMQGIVVAASPTRPRVRVATYICTVCGSETVQEVVGATFLPKGECMGADCGKKGGVAKLKLQIQASRVVEQQELRLQELPDEVPHGSIPRTMRVVVSGALCGLAAPGGTVKVCGYVAPLPLTGMRAMLTAVTSTEFVGLHLTVAPRSYDRVLGDTTAAASRDATERYVAALARGGQQEVYDALMRSVAPEIFGVDDIKRVILLQLAGGVPRARADGLRVRGDINVILLGDPGVSKSQLLRWAARLAPRSVFTTGRGSSGVGLTAAVVKDERTGDIVLEGGALVVADEGLCCIDEFDKMRDHDRGCIYEVMEQQTVSVTKAGLITRLNARASVLAAANPKQGRWNRRRTVEENVDLPAALLSRFDVVWLLVDIPRDEHDRALALFIVSMHVDKPKPAADAATLPDGALPPLSMAALRQFIGRARQHNPTVPPDLVKRVALHYVDMRRDRAPGEAIVTPRALLSVLRLAQARARLRLSDDVSLGDIEEAVRLTAVAKSSVVAPDGVREAGARQRRAAEVAIYEMIRERLQRGRSDVVQLASLKQQFALNGYDATAVSAALHYYEAYQVWEVGADETYVRFLHAQDA